MIAFFVGDLAYVEETTSGVQNGGKPVLVRVYTLKGNEETGRFALSVAVDCLEYFAGVFGIPYPLPKCDMVAIPDFEAGAMENWGLITYRTTAVLFDPKASDARFKQRIAYTVCHELAHQWFGNLVTMEWWDHLWLNEGFATWVGYLAVEKIFPDWDIWTQFVSEGFQRGLKLDSLKSSHQIEVPVNDPSEISQIFDAISYYKGSSVILMLSNYLGENVFLAGVRRYLKKHEYGNASTNDLWDSLAQESGRDISEFISVWTRKVGYPVLTVTEPSPDTLNISQSRFLSTGVIDPEEDITTWWVPLSIDVGSGDYKDFRDVVLTQKEKSLKLPPPVKKGMLETSDRVGLVADAGALATSGHGKTSGLLNLIKEFDKEDQYIVWMEISNCLSDLTSVWFEQPDYQGLLAFQCDLLSELVRKLGWEYSDDDDYLTTMLRTLVIKIAGKAGDKDVVNESHRRFKLFIKGDESALHPNIRGAVYEIVLIHGGGEEEFEAILNLYKTGKIADQRIIILSALGHAQQENLIQRALN
ncbi:13973_t:CDS:10, partial [Dentiscutata erythropus]